MPQLLEEPAQKGSILELEQVFQATMVHLGGILMLEELSGPAQLLALLS